MANKVIAATYRIAVILHKTEPDVVADEIVGNEAIKALEAAGFKVNAITVGLDQMIMEDGQ